MPRQRRALLRKLDDLGEELLWRFNPREVPALVENHEARVFSSFVEPLPLCYRTDPIVVADEYEGFRFDVIR